MKRFTDGEIGWTRNLLLATIYKVAEKESFGTPLTLDVMKHRKEDVDEPWEWSFCVFTNFGRNGNLPLDPRFYVRIRGNIAHVRVGFCLGFNHLETHWRVKVKTIRHDRRVLKVGRWRLWHHLPSDS